MGARGKAVQVDPIKPVLKPPGTWRLKLKYDKLPSFFAFNIKLRRFSEAWRDGTPRARATLLLALRDALSRMDARAAAPAVRSALWTLLRDTWSGAGGAGGATEGNDETETNDNVKNNNSEADPMTPAVLRVMARNGSKILPTLARSALLALMEATPGATTATASAGDAAMLDEAFALMAVSDNAGGEGLFSSALNALLAASERGGVPAIAFLATRAAADPEAGANTRPLFSST